MEITAQNKAIVRRLYEEIVRSDDLKQLHEIFAENYIGVGVGNGSSAFAQAVGELQRAFPDIQWTIHDLFGEGQKVAIRWSWKGTHQGVFKGFPASGKVIQTDANAIYFFENGKIIRSWLQSDRLGVLQQIGAMP